MGDGEILLPLEEVTHHTARQIAAVFVMSCRGAGFWIFELSQHLFVRMNVKAKAKYEAMPTLNDG